MTSDIRERGTLIAMTGTNSVWMGSAHGMSWGRRRIGLDRHDDMSCGQRPRLSLSDSDREWARLTRTGTNPELAR